MVEHDPNGEAWEDWKRAGYDSYETFIEAKAGACPPVAFETLPGYTADGIFEWGQNQSAWPQPKPPPFLADDEGSDDPAKA